MTVPPKWWSDLATVVDGKSDPNNLLVVIDEVQDEMSERRRLA